MSSIDDGGSGPLVIFSDDDEFTIMTSEAHFFVTAVETFFPRGLGAKPTLTGNDLKRALYKVPCKKRLEIDPPPPLG